jgi:dephospho-CoA kinase
MNLFILIGAPGTGKTWLCDKLSNDFNIIYSDRIRDGIDKAVSEALKGDKPVIVDIPFKIKAFIERWRSRVPESVVVALVEEEDVHKTRLAMRGGELTDSVKKRVARVNSIFKKYGNISGNQSHLINRLEYEALKLKLQLPQDKSMVIYKATSPSGKIYVGQSKNNFRHRVWRHYYSALVMDHNYPFMSALKKYRDQIVWEIVAEADNDEKLNELEIELISNLKSNDPNTGYNCTSGGPGWSGMKLADNHPFKTKSYPLFTPWNKGRKGVQPKMTDEHKQKLIEVNKRRKPSELHMKKLAERNATGWQSAPDIREKISNANKGQKLTDDQLQNLREATAGEKNGMYGKKHSDETKNKMSESKKALMADDEFKSKFRKAKSKYSIISPTGEVFLNDRDASAKTGIGRAKVRKMVLDPSSGWSRVQNR